jgi:hypothetical protein
MFVSFVQTAIEIWTLCSGATQRELLLLRSAGMHQGLKCIKRYITLAVGIHAKLWVLDSPKERGTVGK